VKHVLLDGGAFAAPTKLVRAGASYVQALSRVPDEPAICAVTENPKPAPAPVWQSIVVPETHTEAAHIVVLRRIVAVISAIPKLVPKSVAVDPPVSGAFGRDAAVAIGASYMNLEGAAES